MGNIMKGWLSPEVLKWFEYSTLGLRLVALINIRNNLGIAYNVGVYDKHCNYVIDRNVVQFEINKILKEMEQFENV